MRVSTACAASRFLNLRNFGLIAALLIVVSSQKASAESRIDDRCQNIGSYVDPSRNPTCVLLSEGFQYGGFNLDGREVTGYLRRWAAAIEVDFVNSDGSITRGLDGQFQGTDLLFDDSVPPDQVQTPIPSEEFSDRSRSRILNIIYRMGPSSKTNENYREGFQLRIRGPGAGTRGSVDLVGDTFTEGSPAFMTAFADFSDLSPEGQIEFDFAWINAGDGDWFGLYFNEVLLWNSYGLTFEEGLLYTALFNANLVAGQSGNFTIFLHSVGDTNAQLFVPTDYSAWEASTGAVPEPSTWAMMLIGFGAVGYTMRRRRKAALVAQPAL